MTEDELLHAETFRDRVTTVDDRGKRNWIYALKPSGRFYKYRNIVSYFSDPRAAAAAAIKIERGVAEYNNLQIIENNINVYIQLLTETVKIIKQ